MHLLRCYLIQQDISHTPQEVFDLNIWRCCILPAASNEQRLCILWIYLFVEYILEYILEESQKM